MTVTLLTEGVNSTFTLADSGSGTDNNSGMMSGVGVGTSQARSQALTCAPTTFPQGTPSTRRALPPTIPAEPILASTAAALTTSALSAKTAANWQAFPPQTLAFTVPTFFWPCNLRSDITSRNRRPKKKIPVDTGITGAINLTTLFNILWVSHFS